ncbi:MAG TPA: hypothetical protein DEQ02_01820 [Ruminococcaceae bacterium]|nr:hypothetical protein [Oscillospiraceae bacterium]
MLTELCGRLRSGHLLEPGELLPPKNGEYRTATHGSLVISKGKWIWNRGGVGGRSAVDYLVSVRGMRFNDAVETVLGYTEWQKGREQG